MSRIRSTPNPFALSVVLALSLINLGSTSRAAEGDPVAIRFWPHDAVTVETHGGLTLGIRMSDHSKTESEANADAEVDQWVAIDSVPNHVLARIPNQPNATYEPLEASNQDLESSIRITSGSTNDANLIRIEVDGLRIAAGSAASIAGFEADGKMGSLDVLLVIGDLADQAPALQQAAKRLAPRYLLVAGGKDVATLDSNVREQSHNTFGLASTAKKDGAMKVVAMGTTAWQLPEDMAKLFKAMHDSNQKSQAVFAKLSTDQMNFKPSNGTHTPRWNTEHMMGRQLMFFSQIYHAIDPSMPVMNLNPAQMPPDYSAAHPDWDGAEEARQMQRVDDFCHRFAHLLDGLDMGKKAPGSRWPSLRALLVQMDRHYSEHTANTVKKFDLEDWPKK